MLLRRDSCIGETLCSAVRNVKTRVPLFFPENSERCSDCGRMTGNPEVMFADRSREMPICVRICGCSQSCRSAESIGREVGKPSLWPRDLVEFFKSTGCVLRPDEEHS